MIVSPSSMWEARSSMVWPVISPEGTITHAARGWSGFSTKSATELAAVAPSVSNTLTVSGSVS